MAILPNVGRRSPAMVAVVAFIYLALTVLGATMVIPFMMTVASSTTNSFDYERFLPLPRFLWSTEDRFWKGLVLYFNSYSGYNSQLRASMPAIPDHWTSWSAIGRDIDNSDRLADPFVDADEQTRQRWRVMAADYSAFADNYPLADCVCPVDDTQAALFLRERYRILWRQAHSREAGELSSSELDRRALDMLSARWGVDFENFFSIKIGEQFRSLPIWQQAYTPRYTASYADFQVVKLAYRNHRFTPGVEDHWRDFLHRQDYEWDDPHEVFPVQDFHPERLRQLWADFKAGEAPASPVVPYALRAAWYGYLSDSEEVLSLAGLAGDRLFTLADYNRLAGTDYDDLWRTPFPVPQSFAPGIQAIWERFVETRYPLRLVHLRLDAAVHERYAAFLAERFRTLTTANELLGTDVTAWDEFRCPGQMPAGKGMNERAGVWIDFVKTLPRSHWQLGSSEIAFQQFLREKYGDVAAVNAAYGWDLARMEEGFPPFLEAYAVTFHENRTAFLVDPIVSNYAVIVRFLLGNSHAVLVTVILITLSIGMVLTVNPMAAYALSRFNLRGKDKIILFMLATMAFPTMVSAIPAYLLMRDLGLLNTFFALVLPSAANGMSIFILKGFFDSLPPELYEAATIDGAREWQIFLIVTLPMMKPILAINALNAFIMSYNGWQWALIICQDKDMWTIAVWMYQASLWWQEYPWIVTAGFVVTSIPTLLVFLTCQKIIMRGIIIPQMK